jgi:F-type H+-transporting ATPase subunit gamma
MGQSLKQIRNRIRGIENTRKITQVMEMVSAVKLNRINKLLFAMRPYFSRLESLVCELCNSQIGKAAHPFLRGGVAGGKACLCVVTADAGLCGGYNNNLIRLAQDFLRGYARDKVCLICVGRKGYNYFKKNQYQILSAHLGLNGKYSPGLQSGIENDLTDIFLSGRADQVYVAYTHYRTALIHQPLLEKFLPVEPAEVASPGYILEPDIGGILNRLIPRYISMKLRLIILDALTAEQSARVIAMRTATDNAADLLQDLTVLRNKVRQANITQEIMEIVSSSEALKG